jgi:PAS domain S-box-containing protein
MADRMSEGASKFLARFSGYTSVLGIGFGVMVLTGWTLHIQRLKGLIPGQVAVKANTAICFILLGTALWLATCDVPKRFARLWTTALGLLASFIGLLSFLEYWNGWDLGIDQLLFKGGAGDLPGSVRLGLMSPISAVDFLLLGIAVALLDVGGLWARALQSICPTVAAMAAMFGILDFVLEPQKTHTHIAPMTALVLFLFSLAVLWARAEGGLAALLVSGTVGGVLCRRLLPPAILVPIGIAWLGWKGQEAGWYTNWAGQVIMAVSAGILLLSLIVWTALVIDRTDAGRRKAEESARNLAAIVTSSNEGIIGKTLDGIVTTWNSGAEVIYGYSEEEMIGQSVTRIIPPDLLNEFQEFLRHLRHGQSIRHRETERIRKDGKRIAVSISISPLKDEKGNLVGASTIARDITERKQAEEDLRRSESRYRCLVTATAQIVWSSDPEGQVVDDMPMWRAFTGTTRTQIAGAGWLDSLHPDDRNRTEQVWTKACRNREPYETEYRIRRADGVYRTFSVRRVPVLEDDGTVREWVGTCTDITERRRAEEEVRQAAQYVRTLLEVSLDPLVTIGKDGKIRDVNRATEDVTGCSRDRLIGTDFSNYFTEPDTARRGYESVFAQGAMRDYPLVIRSTSGTVTDVVYNASVFKNAAGEVEGVFAAARDVTRMKAAELEVRRLNEELEQRVILRTAQLAAANKELEAFTYSVSHDLRAPLRHISGFSKILAEEFAAGLPPEAQTHLQRIQEGTRRMGQLVDDLLNLARVGRREPTLQVAGLRSIVDEVINSLKAETADRQVEWKIGDLPYVECDTALIQQVFQNLLSNALKFTRPRSHAVIEIGQELQDGKAVVYVRDNGVGFSMKYSDKLFGVFQRLHRAEDFEGTGVGLATVQRIIQKHGGRVWAEAELDKGASFYFTLGTYETSGEKAKTIAAGENHA